MSETTTTITLKEPGTTRKITFGADEQGKRKILERAGWRVVDEADVTTPLAETKMPANLVGLLAEHGYDTIEAACAATDGELLALSGIGQAALKKVRALC